AASAPNPVMKVHAVNGDMECLGKEGADGMVIPAFPTFERAREGYCGPHQVRSRLRQRAAPNRGFIVQGVSA
ncbi:MAG: hypothetical protein N2423_04980, partial [Novosphingobium sp.]|nr:hypothetical protein [Novosphingobium sp.]